VITGFNTDVEFQGTTYHVQTEDKGLATPLILSLVYNRGTILASKRSPYDDLLKNFDEKVLAERLQKQHKLICAAIQAGRIEDLKRMTEKDAAVRRPGAAIPPVEPVKTLNGNQKVEVPQPPPVHNNLKIAPSMPPAKPVEAVPEKKSAPAAPPVFERAAMRQREEIGLKSFAEIIHSEPVIEAVRIIEEEVILPAEAVEIIADDSIIKASSAGRLQIKIIGDDNFKSGEKRTISIIVYRGSAQFGSGGAQVMLKIIGSAFRPQIFHSKTDFNGVATVHLQMPQFKTGRAVLLIKAINDGEETEIRRVIRHK
jgi:hypothetical protein